MKLAAFKMTEKEKELDRRTYYLWAPGSFLVGYGFFGHNMYCLVLGGIIVIVWLILVKIVIDQMEDEEK